MYVLGINSVYHESSACLIDQGQVVAAIEQERLNHIKRGKPCRIDTPDQLPNEAVRYCLDVAGVELSDISHIAFSFDPSLRRAADTEMEDGWEGNWGSRSGNAVFLDRLARIPGRLATQAGVTSSPWRLNWVAHHLSHAASAFLVSPFEEAAILAIDGIGEVCTAWLGYGRGGTLTRLQGIRYPNSLGFLWEKLSEFLGFSSYDAAKVMGLAGYGDRRRFRAPFERLVSLTEDGGFRVDRSVAAFRSADMAGLEALFGPSRQPGEALKPRHADVAAALQDATEHTLLHMVRWLREETGTRNLCMAGGVALNCVANAKIAESGLVDDVFIQPAAHDAGTALGAAMYVWNSVLGRPRTYVMDSVYLGPEFAPDEIEQALRDAGLHFERDGNIERTVARHISEGHIVAWHQGRLEFGPRALGNRSILADPRRPEAREALNRIVKRREPFRPFGASVLAHKASEWFELPSLFSPCEYMLAAFRLQPEKAPQVPAVTHVDGGSRIHAVRESANPRFFKLIEEFDLITGVPLVLNTSLNREAPIACTPKDSIRTFLSSGVDKIAIGPFIAARPEQRSVRLLDGMEAVDTIPYNPFKSDGVGPTTHRWPLGLDQHREEVRLGQP